MVISYDDILPFHSCSHEDFFEKPIAQEKQKECTLPVNTLKDCNQIKSITDCNFYSKNSFNQSHESIENFNIFHNNFNGLESKFDLFHHFLKNCSKDFDILAISETSQKLNSSCFQSNVDLKGYNLFSTPSSSSRGGTALYIKDIYNAFERIDLSIKSDSFESTWVEIKNEKNVTLSVE